MGSEVAINAAICGSAIGGAIAFFFGWRAGYRHGLVIGKLKGVSEYIRAELEKHHGR